MGEGQETQPGGKTQKKGVISKVRKFGEMVWNGINAEYPKDYPENISTQMVANWFNRVGNFGLAQKHDGNRWYGQEYTAYDLRWVVNFGKRSKETFNRKRSIINTELRNLRDAGILQEHNNGTPDRDGEIFSYSVSDPERLKQVAAGTLVLPQHQNFAPM